MKVVEEASLVSHKDMLPFVKHEESGMGPMEEYLTQNPRKGHVVDIFGKFFKRVVQEEGSHQEDKLNFLPVFEQLEEIKEELAKCKNSAERASSCFIKKS